MGTIYRTKSNKEWNKIEQRLTKKDYLKALESSLGVVTTALKATDLSRTNFYKWLKEDEEFKAKVEEIESIQQDFIKSKVL